MKNLKKFYQNNRIYCILMIVSAICLIVILTSVIIYFFSQTSSSVYGHRLDDIAEHQVDKEIEDLKGFFDSNDKVKYSSIDKRGKIIYVVLDVNEALANEDIQSLCTESLDKLTKDQKEYYDIQFIVKRDGLNPYLGSKSAHQTVLSWANYSYNDEEEENQEGE